MSNSLINNYLSVFGSYAFISIDNTDSPYQVIDKDGIISVDTSVAPIVINLPKITASSKKTYTIIDSTGDCNTNNITLNAFAGDLINKSATIPLVNNFNSLTIQNDETTDWIIISASTNESQLPSFIGPTIYLEGTTAVDNAVSIVASNTGGGIEITPGSTGAGTNFTRGVFRFTSTSSSTGNSAIPVTTIVHSATSDGPGGGPGVQNTLTLADGQEGQKLHIIYIIEGHPDDDILIVPVTPRGYANLNLIEVGDSVELLFQDACWNVVGGFNTIVGAPTLSGPTVFIEGTTSVFNAVHITASGAGGGFMMDAGTAGFDIDTTGPFLVDATLQLCLTSTQAAADAICIYADNAAGGVQIRAGTAGDIDFNRGAMLWSSTGTITSTGVSAAIGLNDIFIEITTTTAADLLSIPDGTLGQILHLAYKAEGAPGDIVTITPDSPFDFTDIIFTDLGDTMVLLYRTEGWYITGGNVIGAFGGVSGPGASTDDAIVRWDGVTGTFVQNSVAILTDLGALSGLIALDTVGGTGQMLLQTSQAAVDAIELNASAGGIDMDAAATFDIDISGGQVLISSKDNVASAIQLLTNVGTTETIVITNTLGTATNAIDINALAGGFDLDTLTVITLTAGTNMTLQAGTTGDIDLNQGALLLSSTLSLTGADPGPVAITLHDMVVEITTVAVTIGDINLFTLANGTDGQMLKIAYVAESAGVETALITPTSAAGFTDFTFNDLGDTVELIYRTTGGWYITGGNMFGAMGGVSGPGSSTDNALVRWNMGAGTMIQNSVGILTDGGALSGLTGLDADGASQMLLRSSLAAADAIKFDATAGGVDIDASTIVAITAGTNLTLAAGTTGDIDFNQGALLLSSTGTITSTGVSAAIGLDDIVMEVTTTTSADLLSLANGTAGQVLKILYVAEGAVGDKVTITPTTLAGHTDITLNVLGDTVELIYRATGGWHITSGTATFNMPNAAPRGWVHAKITWSDTDTITVGIGGETTIVRDSNNLRDLTFSGTKDADITVIGAGGRQTASANSVSTWYKIAIIGDTTDTNPTDILLIPDGTAFNEAGYDLFRIIGHVRNDSSGDFLKFFCTGLGTTKTYHYDEFKSSTQVLTSGSSTTFVNIDCSSFVSPVSELATFLLQFNSSATTSDVRMRPDGSTATNLQVLYTSQTGLNTTSDLHSEVTVPLVSQIFEYNVSSASDNVDIFVISYVEEVI